MVYPGLDYSTFLTDSRGLVTGSDMDTSFTPISGPQVCVETILRKLMSPAGSYDDASWGIDLRTRLNASMSSSDLAQLAAQVRTAINEEEYVDDSDVQCTLSAAGALNVLVTLTLADDQTYRFAFTLGADGIQVILGVGQGSS